MNGAQSLSATQVYKNFDAPGGERLEILSDITLTFAPGEWVSLTGPSGSGKSTLLSLLSGLDTPTAGQISYGTQTLAHLNAQGDDVFSQFRAQHMGFVFQSFHLVPALSALENVMLPLELLGAPYKEAKARAQTVLERVGLGSRMNHDPRRLSGGEQQRVALARALVHRPQYLFADEPTGNLDQASGATVLDLITELRAELKSETTVGATLIMVTHDPVLAARADRQIHLRDGRIVC
jgi:putative ABC transport system ATP-binding protein